MIFEHEAISKVTSECRATMDKVETRHALSLQHQNLIA